MIKKYHVSKQLFDKDNPDIVEYYTNSTTGVYTYSQNTRSVIIPCEPNTTYSATKTVQTTSPRFNLSCYDNYPQENDIATAKEVDQDAMQLTLTTTANSQYLVVFFYYLNPPNASEIQQVMDTLMVNEGQPLPYEPYGNTWNTKSYAKSITGAQTYTKFPIVLRTTEQSIPTWSMDGNTETSGTPSSSNPVMPNGVGERTSNLIEGVISNSVINTSGVIEASQNYSTMYAPVTSGETYTFAYSASGIDVNYIYGLFATLPKSGSITYDNSRVVVSYSTSTTITLTIPSGVSYIGIRIPNAALTTNKGIMINQGSEVATYEPWGYKIPIVSNSTTLSPIYLSEQLMKIGDTVDSLVSAGTVTYNIKKLVLTGEEQWSAHYSGNGLYSLSGVDDYLSRNINISICSHYNTMVNVSGYSAVTDKTVTFYTLAGSTVRVMYLRDTDFANVTALKSFLSNQYANGTPVTVYYILTTPTTETVTAPSIPTTSGLNTIDVNTTVKPSEMSLTYDGYKICKEQKYQNNAWT